MFFTGLFGRVFASVVRDDMDLVFQRRFDMDGARPEPLQVDERIAGIVHLPVRFCGGLLPLPLLRSS